MMRITLASAIAVLIFTGEMSRGVQVTQSNLPAELKVLEHYLVAWNVEIMPADQFTRGMAKAEWILDGRFVQQNSEMQSADGKTRAKITILLTYDSRLSKYRRWAFVSDGMTSEGEGTWDAAARKMTFVTRNAEVGSTMTVTADFSVADTETWRMVNTDRAGKVLFERSGKNTRKK